MRALKIFIWCIIGGIVSNASSQNVNDSIPQKWDMFEFNFSKPGDYIVKNILVEGNDKIQPALVVIYSGLSIGQTIKIPGNELSDAIRNLWKQQYFSDIRIFVKEVSAGQILVNIVIKEQDQVSRVQFSNNLSHAEKKNLFEEIGVKSGMYLTPNLIARTKSTILAYYREKGHYSATVEISTKDDVEKYAGKKLVYIKVEKGPKVKVYDYDFIGNVALTDAQIRASIKKPKRRKNKINLFSSSKYIEDEFDEQRANILKKYSARGYRDARIVEDTVLLTGKKRVVLQIKFYEGPKYYFRNITWKGNTKYRTGLLDTLLGFKKGDVYNQALLEERLTANPSGFDIQSLYMDDGYLFFNLNLVETGVYNDSIDIEIRIIEGQQAKIRNISWVGNTKTSDRVILREIRTKPGDIFSRGDIQRTMRDLAALGLFDPEQMNVTPKPNPTDGTVDIIYILAEKASDQIELSGGWGGNGFTNRPTLLGTAGVVLNNFSTRKLFKPSLWNPVPSGDGQKLSLRAQSNGGTYQGYTFSFTEPWFGGRKPNSFSVSVFHTVNAYNLLPRDDPRRQVLQNTGFSIALGKRLKWPDDFFSIQYSFSLQRYKFQNLEGQGFGFPAGFKGFSYNPSFQIVLSRSSVSDPIYPQSGSTISLSTQFTPPFSLLNGKDLNTLSVSEKYRWSEFHKWKFDVSWYTTIWKNMVLSTSARFGFLGYYNKQLGLTFFERFRVGGSGLFGFNLAGTEIISQRGYDNFTISDAAIGQDAGAPIFNKYTVELRYALSKNPTATVYAHLFAEAGDAWGSFNQYNPFQLKRAVGAGVRLFMPMFGLIGLDYGYGFDYRQVPASGKPGQFHFFLGQQF